MFSFGWLLEPTRRDGHAHIQDFAPSVHVWKWIALAISTLELFCAILAKVDMKHITYDAFSCYHVDEPMNEMPASHQWAATVLLSVPVDPVSATKTNSNPSNKSDQLFTLRTRHGNSHDLLQGHVLLLRTVLNVKLILSAALASVVWPHTRNARFGAAVFTGKISERISSSA